jgi:DNA-binding NtrC family response regulator
MTTARLPNLDEEAAGESERASRPRAAAAGPTAAASAGLTLSRGLDGLRILAAALQRGVEALDTAVETGGECDALNLSEQVQRFEAELIRSALIKTGGRQRRAARLLGVKVTTLHTKIKRYHIDTEGARLS